MDRIEFIRNFLFAIYSWAFTSLFLKCKEPPGNLSFSPRPDSQEGKLISDHLKNFYKTDSSYHTVGKQYLKMFPDEDHLPKLIHFICSSLKPEDVIFKKLKKKFLDSKKFEYFLSNKIQEDFKNDQTITIDQWILSRTEARIAAAQYVLRK